MLEAEGSPRRSPLLPSFLATIYPWTKALHIIAVVAWMAGLFYLPKDRFPSFGIMLYRRPWSNV